MPENWEMDLGYPGLDLEQLTPYQRDVVGDRLYGYCIYPSDSVERQRYQLCLSFYRQLQLDPEVPDLDIPDGQLLSAANRSFYLNEEKAFFARHGGMEEFVNSRGYEFYRERLGDMLVIAHSLMLMAMWLGQLSNAELPLGITKVAGLAQKDYDRRIKLMGNLQKDTEEDGWMFYPDLGRVFRRGISNSKYCELAWKHYQPALPLVITAFAIMAGRFEQKETSLNSFGVESGAFVSMALSYEAFLAGLTTEKGRLGKGARVVPGEFWKFPAAIIGNRKPQSLKALGMPTEETLQALFALTGSAAYRSKLAN